MYSGYGGSSMYGSGYGSAGSYGSTYGNTYGNSYNSSPYSQINRSPNQNNPQQQQQDPNQRKHAMQQYFKMMNGLQSMIQIGFSFVTFAQCASHFWQLLKKMFGFLLKTSQSMGQKVYGTILAPEKIQKVNHVVDQLMIYSNDTKNGKTLKNKLMFVLRIVSVLGLLIAIKLKSNIEQDCSKKKQDLLEQYKKLKQQQQKQLQLRQLQYGQEMLDENQIHSGQLHPKQGSL